MTASIIMVPIEEVRPYERNPRHNDASIDAVANSIRDFGFRAPLILDKNKTIIAGHTRYKAALKLGLAEVPCIIANDMNRAQIEAYRIADNSAGSKSEWDEDLLGELLEGIDYDMSQYGLEYQPAGIPGEDIDIDPGEIERTGGTIRFNLTEPQVEIVKAALDTVTGTLYAYGNMNSNGNKLTEICKRWMEIEDKQTQEGIL